MEERPSRYILILSDMPKESIVDKAAMTGYGAINRRLNSSPDNWIKIKEVLQDPIVRGAIIVIGPLAYWNLQNPAYEFVTRLLFSAIAQKPHLVLLDLQPRRDRKIDRYMMHIDNLGALSKGEEQYYFMPILGEFGIEVLDCDSYVEVSELSGCFIDDLDNGLVFRIYIPNGQMFQEESGALLDLFHDWLAKVRHIPLRKEGYKTSKGQVIEFFAPPGREKDFWIKEVGEFNEFLSILPDGLAAENRLVQLGVSSKEARLLITNYSKRARRIELDTKQVRDSKIFSLRQEIEASLADEHQSLPLHQITEIIDFLVPMSPQINPQVASISHATSREINVHFNQQIIHKAHGIIAQNIAGDVQMGSEGEKILHLLQEFLGCKREQILPLLAELQDEEAPHEARLNASHKIRLLLGKLSGQVQQASIDILSAWVKRQMGIG